MMLTIAQVFEGEVTEDLLLGTAGTRVDLESRKSISSAVYQFVLATKKDLWPILHAGMLHRVRNAPTLVTVRDFCG